MPVPGVGDISLLSTGGTDYSGLHSALLAVKVWSSGAAAYVWSGDGLAPDPLSYTQILFVDPTGTHNPTTSPGGRSNVNDLWQTGTTPVGVPAGGTTGQVLAKTSSSDYAAGWTTAGGGGGTGLLATNRYNPGTVADYTTVSGTWADIDATNMKVTFTAPASGSVIVSLSAAQFVTASTTTGWGLRSGGVDVTGSQVEVAFGSNESHVTTRQLITGLTASTSYTHTWSHARIGGSGTCHTYAGGPQGQALIEVWSA